jgi:hypothetical protein
MRIVFSDHARKRFLQRDVTKASIRYMIENPDREYQQPNGNYRAERDNSKTWVVVYADEGETKVVVSCWTD